MKRLRLFSFSMALLVLTAGAVRAEEPAAMSAEDAAKAAQMAQMQERMTPGAEHKILEQLAGKWNYTSKMWMTPDAKVEESSGTSEAAVIYGGRFVEEKVKGVFNGQAFEGTGLLGYDKIRGEYVSLWYDNMMTGIMLLTGQYDAAKKTLTASGTASCPITGEKDRKGRMETLFTSPDSHTLTSYSVGPDGQEYKAMEIIYTRAA